jgi:hypothetical protein
MISSLKSKWVSIRITLIVLNALFINLPQVAIIAAAKSSAMVSKQILIIIVAPIAQGKQVSAAQKTGHLLYIKEKGAWQKTIQRKF